MSPLFRANAVRFLVAAALFLGPAASVFANTAIRSVGRAYCSLAYGALLPWLVIGLILRLRHRRVVSFRWLGFGLLSWCILDYFYWWDDAAFEQLPYVWSFYLALLAVYYVRPRAGVSEEIRRISLRYHGSFFLVLLIGGLSIKSLQFLRLGIQAWPIRWLDWFCFNIGLLAGATVFWFYISVIWRDRTAWWSESVESAPGVVGDAPSGAAAQPEPAPPAPTTPALTPNGEAPSGGNKVASGVNPT